MVTPDMDELNFTDSELDYHVRTALKAAVKGDSDFYNQLVGLVHKDKLLTAEDVAQLVTCLKAVTGAITCIDIHHHRALLAAILRMSLWNYGTDVMDALVEFVALLAPSKGDYLDLCLDMLVVNFTPPKPKQETNNPKPIDWLKHQNFYLPKKDQVLSRVLSTVIHLGGVVPMTPLRLQPIVWSRMPTIFSSEPLQYQMMYVENMLKLETSDLGQLLGGIMLVAIVDRLVELDVEIAWDDILDDDFHRGIFDMELEDFEGHVDNIDEDSTELTRDMLIQRFFIGNIFAEKLDSLMKLTLEHLEFCKNTNRLVQVFENLLKSFKVTILTAYKSKFAQFVLFYACSLDPDHCGEMFANSLLEVFVEKGNAELRLSAVAYLASYLARAKFVPISLVASMLESVVNWCFGYCKNHKQSSETNPKAHEVFYAGCQAAMYILCFCMRQMLAVPRIKSQLLNMPIEEILGHPFRPMQVCLRSIVDEFVRLSRANRIFLGLQNFDRFDVLETEHSHTSGELNMFFPFDPCLLRKCDSFIRPNYVYWSMVRSTYDDEDDECTSDEDDEIAEDAHDNVNGIDIPQYGSGRSCNDENSDHNDDFDCSLDNMSITPRDLSANFGGNIQQFMKMPSRIRPSMSPESL